MSRKLLEKIRNNEFNNEVLDFTNGEAVWKQEFYASNRGNIQKRAFAYLEYIKGIIISTMEALEGNRTVRALKFNCTGICADSAPSITKVLEMNMNLTLLHLGSNSLGDEGACLIAEALMKNKSVTDLSLNFNHIKTKGAFAIARLIKSNVMIQILDIGSNNFGSNGIKKIALALKTNGSISIFNLSTIPLCDKDVEIIGQAFRSNSSVTALGLRLAHINDQGAKFMADALMTNKVLTSLDLSLNPQIGSKGSNCFLDALTVNKSLTSLNLSPSPFGCTTVPLNPFLKRNVIIRKFEMMVIPIIAFFMNANPKNQDGDFIFSLIHVVMAMIGEGSRKKWSGETFVRFKTRCMGILECEQRLTDITSSSSKDISFFSNMPLQRETDESHMPVLTQGASEVVEFVFYV